MEKWDGFDSPEMIAKYRRTGYSAERWARAEKIYRTADVQERIDEACKALGEAMAAEMFYHMQRQALWWGPPTESPIELIFQAWWEARETVFMHTTWHNVHGPTLFLTAQHEVEVEGQNFRLDFIVHPAIRNDDQRRFKDEFFPKIGIELDGHEFHEKTKEQVSYRNRRDRLLQQQGWRIFHVSGSELFHRPAEVIIEIHQHCREAYEAFEFKVYEATKQD